MKKYFNVVFLALSAIVWMSAAAKEEDKKARVVRFVPGDPDPQHNPSHNSSQTGDEPFSSTNGKRDYDPTVVDQKTIEAAFAKMREVFRFNFHSVNAALKKEFSKDEQLKMIHNFECQKNFVKEIFRFLRERKQGRLSYILRAVEDFRDSYDCVTLHKYLALWREKKTEGICFSSVISTLSEREFQALILLLECVEGDMALANTRSYHLSAAYKFNRDMLEAFFQVSVGLSSYIEKAYGMEFLPQTIYASAVQVAESYLSIWESAFLQILDDTIAVFSAE